MIRIDRYGDPACPWDFSAEPSRLRMLWHFGDQLSVTPRMVVLSDRPEDYTDKGFTVDRLAGALAAIQARFGMPIEPEGRTRMQGTRLACRAVVAARRKSVDVAEKLLRNLRFRAMRGELLDEHQTIAGGCAEIGLSVAELDGVMDEPATEAQLQDDWRAARTPTPAALRLDHKLADWSRGDESGRRYTCPSWVFHDPGSERVVTAPGFQPFESLEVALADVAPSLERRDPPGSVAEIFEWASGPLATAEVAALRGTSMDAARAELEEAGVRPESIGPEWIWRPR